MSAKCINVILCTILSMHFCLCDISASIAVCFSPSPFLGCLGKTGSHLLAHLTYCNTSCSGKHKGVSVVFSVFILKSVFGFCNVTYFWGKPRYLLKYQNQKKQKTKSIHFTSFICNLQMLLYKATCIAFEVHV